MKIEVIEEKENPLLGRKEVVAKVIHSASTPSRADVRSKAIAALKAKKDALILDSIKTRFGVKESIAYIRVYKSRDRAFEIEDEHIIRKNFPEAVEKKEEAPKKEKGKGKEELEAVEVEKEEPTKGKKEKMKEPKKEEAKPTEKAEKPKKKATKAKKSKKTKEKEKKEGGS
ncbi:MAG: hypothetical protein ACE5PM_09250 [Candidatus Hydrothermarchaeales archaeon]